MIKEIRNIRTMYSGVKVEVIGPPVAGCYKVKRPKDGKIDYIPVYWFKGIKELKTIKGGDNK